MIDVASFLSILVYMLGAVLLVVLIVLGIKLIYTVGKIDNILNELEIRLDRTYKMFSFIDNVNDKMSLISDQVIDGIVVMIRKLFFKNKGKEDENNE